jgi:hypothetical protein
MRKWAKQLVADAIARLAAQDTTMKRSSRYIGYSLAFICLALTAVFPQSQINGSALASVLVAAGTQIPACEIDGSVLVRSHYK